MSVWQTAEFDDHEQACFSSDAKCGLRAIDAIHSPALGRAVGGVHSHCHAGDSLALYDGPPPAHSTSRRLALAGLPDEDRIAGNYDLRGDLLGRAAIKKQRPRVVAEHMAGEGITR